jgi:acyl phosphate:glycerol-3-phosphate acyltransferase
MKLWDLSILTMAPFLSNFVQISSTNHLITLMQLLFPVLSCYLIGSFPTAYIVVKRVSRLDIRAAGSGNVGGFNAYEVTGRKVVGFAIALVDALKGAVAVGGLLLLGESNPAVIAAGLVAVIVGHCFPVWLKFRGGRGLATAAGAMVVAAWPLVLVWMICWTAVYLPTKNIHVGNVAALILMPLAAVLWPESQFAGAAGQFFSRGEFLTMIAAFSFVLLLKHVEPIKILIKEKSRI